MSIIAAFVVPHPPVAVPEIGRGEERSIIATLAAYEKVGEEIARLKPDTLIVSSPHAEAYADYFQLSEGEVGLGSFARFGAPQVTFRVFYDSELTKKIAEVAKRNSFPSGILGQQEHELDHGTMVPLYFINKHYRDYKLVRTGLSGLPLIEHYRYGMLIKEAVEATSRRVVYIASGDLSHCQKPDGPYGYKSEGPRYDERLMKSFASSNFGDLFAYDPAFLEKAEECGHRSFCIMAGALDRVSLTSQVLGHEASLGVGYGFAEFLAGEADPSRAFGDLYLAKEALRINAKKENSDAYVRLARQAIENFVRSSSVIEPDPFLPSKLLSERSGVFVSIHENGDLRGCIGTTMATTKNIAEEIISNAIAACSHDPRFSPIEAKELPYLDISVDVLSTAEEIPSKEDLDPKTYGVIVEKDERRGLLLPDLPGVDSVDEQIAIAKRKAGIAKEEAVTLYRFTVIRHV